MRTLVIVSAMTFMLILNGAGSAQEDDTTSSVEGTKWAFSNATKDTVEFLADGKILFHEKEVKGFWKQEDTSLTINVNDFTLFKLTIDGDKMEGTWERLKGEDKGKKFPSTLTRFDDTTSSVEGTKWVFDSATKDTVEFLADGKILFKEKAVKGFWKQEDASLSINVNDFTLFNLTIDGDKMEGTWERLQGEDKGKKFPSTLTRFEE